MCSTFVFSLQYYPEFYSSIISDFRITKKRAYFRNWKEIIGRQRGPMNPCLGPAFEAIMGRESLLA